MNSVIIIHNNSYIVTQIPIPYLRRHGSHGQPVVPCETEVGNLDAAFVGHEQVGNLEVAMHYEVGM